MLVKKTLRLIAPPVKYSRQLPKRFVCGNEDKQTRTFLPGDRRGSRKTAIPEQRRQEIHERFTFNPFLEKAYENGQILKVRSHKCLQYTRCQRSSIFLTSFFRQAPSFLQNVPTSSDRRF